MDAVSVFAKQWEELQRSRQQLIKEAEQLRQKLRGITDDESMQQLFAERTMLQQRVSVLEKQIKHHRSNIQCNLAKIAYRKRALDSEETDQDIAKRLKTRRARLQDLKSFDAPPSIIEKEERMIWDLEGQIKEVEEWYQKQNANEELQLSAVSHVLNDVVARISAINSHYRKTKQCLEQEILQMENARQQCHADEVEFATQDRSHFEWILKYDPSYKDDVVRRYRVRFPGESLEDLFPSPMRVLSSCKKQKRRSQASVQTVPIPEATLVPQKSWRLWVTFSATEPGQELPQSQDQFVKILQTVLLARAECRSLDPKIVYDKLMMVSGMSMQQRQEMNKLADVEPRGWKKLRAGKRHRLFLLIDEEKQHIRFLPYPRKKAYDSH